ncbi:MAG: 3-phosphoshikimate 1-carboxyvinyltransferase [bacterium]
MSSETVFLASPGGTAQGQIRVPGDKSISHRSIMLGSLAEGTTWVTGFLDGDDCLATMHAFRGMGVKIDQPAAGSLVIQGVGMHGLSAPVGDVYLGNSGTSMRLMAGLLAGQGFDSRLVGDPSLSGRPMRRVTDPLKSMGANIDTSPDGTPPLEIHGGAKLTGINYEMPVASAQVKSCLLLAGLYAEGETCVTEPAPTRDHTERMLQGFGYSVKRAASKACVEGGGKLTACEIDVPADISSAAFFLVAASIAEGGDLWLEHVGINPTRTGVIDILRLMGASISLHNERDVGGEPVADIHVVASTLKGIDIPEELVPLAIDEFPAIFIAAACAEGETRLTGAEELRVKESDRIQVMADGLSACGIEVEVLLDGIVIQGGQLTQGEVVSHGDHRIAMSFAVAALRSNGVITIRDCENVNTSFPGFARLAAGIGMGIEMTTR